MDLHGRERGFQPPTSCTQSRCATTAPLPRRSKSDASQLPTANGRRETEQGRGDEAPALSGVSQWAGFRHQPDSASARGSPPGASPGFRSRELTVLMTPLWRHGPFGPISVCRAEKQAHRPTHAWVVRPICPGGALSARRYAPWSVKSAVESLEDNKVKVSVEVDETEFDKAMDAAFRRIAREVRIPGFRPGKAPRRILEARIGSAARARGGTARGAPRVLRAGRARERRRRDRAARDRHHRGPRGRADRVRRRRRGAAAGERRRIRRVAGRGPRPRPSDEEIDAQVERMRAQFGELEPVEPSGDRHRSRDRRHRRLATAKRSRVSTPTTTSTKSAAPASCPSSTTTCAARSPATSWSSAHGIPIPTRTRWTSVCSSRRCKEKVLPELNDDGRTRRQSSRRSTSCGPTSFGGSRRAGDAVADGDA